MAAPQTKSLKDLTIELGFGPGFRCNVEFGVKEFILTEEAEDKRLIEAVYFESLNPDIDRADPDSPRSFRLEIHLSSCPGTPAMGISFKEVARDAFIPDDAFAVQIQGTRGNMHWRPLLGIPAIDNLAAIIAQELQIGTPLPTDRARIAQQPALFKRKPS